MQIPFGLFNAPVFFQRGARIISTKYKWQTCLVFFDDIIVTPNLIDKCIDHVNNTLYSLKQTGVTLKVMKCKLFTNKANYFCLIIRPESLKIKHAHTASLRHAPPYKQIEIALFSKTLSRQPPVRQNFCLQSRFAAYFTLEKHFGALYSQRESNTSFSKTSRYYPFYASFGPPSTRTTILRRHRQINVWARLPFSSNNNRERATNSQILVLISRLGRMQLLCARTDMPRGCMGPQNPPTLPSIQNFCCAHQARRPKLATYHSGTLQTFNAMAPVK